MNIISYSYSFFAFGRNRDYYGQTDIAQRADQMSRRNLGPQINISMHYTRIDKTNIPPMRRV